MIYEQSDIVTIKIVLSVLVLACVGSMFLMIFRVVQNYRRLKDFRRNLRKGDYVRTKWGEGRVRANYGDIVSVEFEDRPRRIKNTDIYEPVQKWIIL